MSASEAGGVQRAGDAPELSFIMPCYDEEEVIPYTIPRFVRAFEQAGYRLELVACDNGSSDRTGEILRGFVDEGLPVVPHRVEVNEGYGNGILRSIPHCRGEWIGMIPADGQVDASSPSSTTSSCWCSGRASAPST